MKLSILIAEEYPVVRQGIRVLLEEQQEWTVCGEAATNGETIDKARRLQPDVLLLDVAMSDMDPAEAVSQIRAVCPTVRIVALAAPHVEALAAKALAAGASGLAMKSDATDDFLASLWNIGRSRPHLSSGTIALSQTQPAKNTTSEAMPTDLTPRELEVLKLLAKGLQNRAIAEALDISVRTVDVHRASVMRKLKLDTYSDLIQFAIRHKFIEI